MFLGFFLDASVDLQNPTSSNHTEIWVIILTQPARSILHASSFFHVAIAQVLEPLEVKAHALHFGVELATALDLHDTTLCTDN